MKRHVIVLWGLMILLVFGSQALAMDLKVSGEFAAGGLYLDRTSVLDGVGTEGPSTAFYFQRLRLKTDLVVAPGLTLITRLDAMERSWGSSRSTPSRTLDTLSAGSRAENENIAFDWIYLTYASPIGLWRVGYMNDGAWGTVFMDTSTPRGKIVEKHIRRRLGERHLHAPGENCLGLQHQAVDVHPPDCQDGGAQLFEDRADRGRFGSRRRQVLRRFQV